MANRDDLLHSFWKKEEAVFDRWQAAVENAKKEADDLKRVLHPLILAIGYLISRNATSPNGERLAFHCEPFISQDRTHHLPARFEGLKIGWGEPERNETKDYRFSVKLSIKRENESLMVSGRYGFITPIARSLGLPYEEGDPYRVKVPPEKLEQALPEIMTWLAESGITAGKF